MKKRLQVAEVLRQTRRLKKQLESFARAARPLCERLDSQISPAEIELMSSAEANILGTLEHLLNQDVRDVLRQLNELDELISDRESQIQSINDLEACPPGGMATGEPPQ